MEKIILCNEIEKLYKKCYINKSNKLIDKIIYNNSTYKCNKILQMFYICNSKLIIACN